MYIDYCKIFFNFLYAIIIEQHTKCILPRVLEHLTFKIFHENVIQQMNVIVLLMQHIFYSL